MEVVTLFHNITALLKPSYGKFPLNPPAPETEVFALERDFNFKLPKDYKTILCLHDGEYLPNDNNPLNIFCGYNFLSIAQIRNQLKMWQWTINYWIEHNDDTSVFASIPEDTVQQVFFSPNWFPFAGSYSGNHLAFDFSPAAKGVAGQVITCGSDEEIHYQIAKSFTEFLVFTLEKYQQGRYHSKLSKDPEKDTLANNLPVSNKCPTK